MSMKIKPAIQNICQKGDNEGKIKSQNEGLTAQVEEVKRRALWVVCRRLCHRRDKEYCV
jgi:hypothetical protein